MNPINGNGLTIVITDLMNSSKIRVLLLIGSSFLLLMIPLVAMQFSKEVNWTIFDFLAAGFLLIGVSFSIELIFRLINSKRKRLILLFTTLIFLLMIWIELAVGIFGTPLAGN